MAIDPVVAIIIVVVVLVCGGLLLADFMNKRKMKKVDAERREERANQERLEQERLAEAAEAKRKEAEIMDNARLRMARAHQDMHEAQQDFRACHDEIIANIHALAKEGCDAEFQQRFGITRPPKADTPNDDAEVQEYLRGNYAELRDAALANKMERLIEEEVDRRIAAACKLEEDGNATDDSPAEIPEAGTAEVETPEVEPDAQPAEQPEAQPEEPQEAESEERPDEPQEPEAGDAPFDRTPYEDAVREELDVESVRTYLLAAISARYDADGKPIADLPWPAFTTFSKHGYGELTLAKGTPEYAQDDYRNFAWKRFHTGKRADKPTRGEYSWPESHELGDGEVIESVVTPAGAFSVQGPNGTMPLYELASCSWMRHSLEFQGALLEPECQRSFCVDVTGLHKGDTLQLHFDGADFLEDADDGPFFLNAVGAVGDAFVSLSASKPEVASPGEAPYELAERTPTGFTFTMTSDARQKDIDMFPQFLEVHLAWAQPPTPRPERIVRHVAN